MFSSPFNIILISWYSVMADFSRSPVMSPGPVTLLGNGAFMAIFSTNLRETVMVPSMSAGGGLYAFGQGAVSWVVPWKWSAHLYCCSFLVVRSSHIATDLSVCLPKLSGERQQPTEKKTATHRGYEAANQVKKLKKKKRLQYVTDQNTGFGSRCRWKNNFKKRYLKQSCM